MVSVYDLKPRFQTLLRPLCARLAAIGVTANQVTTAAAVMSIALGCLVAATGGRAWTLFLVPPVLFVRMALNAIDGMLAREFAQKSRLGAVLNELGDVVSDTALYLPFAVIPGVSAILTGLVVAIAIMTEMAGVVAIRVSAARAAMTGRSESDRALFFGALALALAAGVRPGLWTAVVLRAGGLRRPSHDRQSGAQRAERAMTAVGAFFSTPVHLAIAAIYAVLIFASVITRILRQTSPGPTTAELSQRVISWWWMITVFTIAILTTRVVSTIFLGFVAFLALKEYLSLVPTRRVDRSTLLWAYLSISVQFYFAHQGQFGLFMVFIPVWMFLFLPARITLADTPRAS